MKLEDYKTILDRHEGGSWVAEISAIAGCYALMSTREAALAELTQVFAMIAEETHHLYLISVLDSLAGAPMGIRIDPD
jgi:predicted RNase H-like HicB family nuclease